MNAQFKPAYPAGLLNTMLETDDPRPAAEQFDERYAHGGGWSAFGGDKWKLDYSATTDVVTLTYDDDEDYPELARAQLRDETVILFEGSWVAIIQDDDTFEVARMD
jgi:hypothetical protein